MKAVQLFVSLSVYSVDDANERDVFDRLFEAAPEKLGAVKTVNVIHVHTHIILYATNTSYTTLTHAHTHTHNTHTHTHNTRTPF